MFFSPSILRHDHLHVGHIIHKISLTILGFVFCSRLGEDLVIFDASLERILLRLESFFHIYEFSFPFFRVCRTSLQNSRKRKCVTSRLLAIVLSGHSTSEVEKRDCLKMCSLMALFSSLIVFFTGFQSSLGPVQRWNETVPDLTF